MTDTDTRAVLDDLWGRLWAGGHSDPLIAIEQISLFILLKHLDVTQPRLRDGREPAASAFNAHSRLRWETLRSLPPTEMLAVLESELIPLLAGKAGPSFERAMEGSRLALADPSLVRACMESVEKLGIGVEVADQGEIYEALLAQLQLSGRHGQLRTPPGLRRAMVELVDPQPGQSLCDPAAGTGSLLVEAARHLREQGGEPDGRNLRGYDVNEGMVRLAALNLLFHGVGEPMIEHANTVARDFERLSHDVVITNPPFGEALSRDDVSDDLAAAGRRTELLFLELSRLLLREGGRAAVLVPQAVLFGKTSDFVGVRRNWLEHGSVEAVISLPVGVLEPYTNVRTAIILASAGGETETVWFCQIPDGPESSRRDGSADERLGNVAAAVRSRLEDRVPNGEAATELAESMWSAEIDQIEARNWNLLPSQYAPTQALVPNRDDPLQLLEQVEVGQAEIDQSLAEARRLLEGL